MNELMWIQLHEMLDKVDKGIELTDVEVSAMAEMYIILTGGN